jgi:DNA (cytosine-5)-methyltransferase 1
VERERYRLRIEDDGLIYTAGGTLFDAPPTATRDWVVVVDGDGRIYGAADDRIHSTFLAGTQAAWAGIWHAGQGKLIRVTDASGHYRPPHEYTWRIVSWLRRQGVLVRDDQVGFENPYTRRASPAAPVSLPDGFAVHQTPEGRWLAARDHSPPAQAARWAGQVPGTLHAGTPGDPAAGHPVLLKTDIIDHIQGLPEQGKPARVVLHQRWASLADGQAWADDLGVPVTVPAADPGPDGRVLRQDPATGAWEPIVTGVTYYPLRAADAPMHPHPVFRPVAQWAHDGLLEPAAGRQETFTLPAAGGAPAHTAEIVPSGLYLRPGPPADDAFAAAARHAGPPASGWSLLHHPQADQSQIDRLLGGLLHPHTRRQATAQPVKATARDAYEAAYATLYRGMSSPSLLARTALDLRSQIDEHIRFSGPGAEPASHLPEVLDNPQVRDSLTAITRNLDHLAEADPLVLASMIDDLLLGASLVPAREVTISPPAGPDHQQQQAIETITPGRLANLLHDIVGWLETQKNPLAADLLGALGYDPGQPLVERLFRLSLLSLPKGTRAMMLNSKLFLELLGAPPWLLAEAWYATTGQPLPTIAGLMKLGGQLFTRLWVRGRRAVVVQPLETWRKIKEGIGDLIRGRDVTRDQARAKLEQLTAQWDAQLQALYHAVQADISAVLPGIPGMPDNGRRALPGQPVHWVSVPSPPAARQELWQDLNQHGPALAWIGEAGDAEFVYVRAELAGDRPVFAVTDDEGIQAIEHIQASDLPGTYLFLLPQAAPIEVAAGAAGSLHLFVGMPASQHQASRLAITQPGVAVVHGIGQDGQLPAPPGHIAAALTQHAGPRELTAVVLAGCQLTPIAQPVADATRRPAWATLHTVWASPDGRLFAGDATVTASGHLLVGTAGTWHRYHPGGTEPVPDPGPPPITVLTAQPGDTLPGQWEHRGSRKVPRRREPALDDVAAAAGVTRGIASLARRRPEAVTAATRAAVETAIRDVGYRHRTWSDRRALPRQFSQQHLPRRVHFERVPPERASRTRVPATANPARQKAGTCIELFTGAGALALALEEAGFMPLAVNDHDGFASQTLLANRAADFDPAAPSPANLGDPWPLLHGDIRELDFSRWHGSVDLLAGGVPCQPWSGAGNREGEKDKLNLWPQFLRAVRQTRPRAVLAENVSGILYDRFRPYFDYIVRQLTAPFLAPAEGERWQDHDERLAQALASPHADPAERYDVQWVKLNAADYGAPHRRQRVFLVAIRGDIAAQRRRLGLPPWQPPPPTHSQAALDRAQAPAGPDQPGPYWQRHHINLPQRGTRPLPSQDGDGRQPWRTVRDATTGMPEPQPAPSATQEHDGWLHHYHWSAGKERSGREPISLDNPSWAITAYPSTSSIVRLDDRSVRWLTIAELKQLVGLPRWWWLAGTPRIQHTQLGNAVPLPLGRALADSIAAALQPASPQDSAIQPGVTTMAHRPIHVAPTAPAHRAPTQTPAKKSRTAWQATRPSASRPVLHPPSDDPATAPDWAQRIITQITAVHQQASHPDWDPQAPPSDPVTTAIYHAYGQGHLTQPDARLLEAAYRAWRHLGTLSSLPETHQERVHGDTEHEVEGWDHHSTGHTLGLYRRDNRLLRVEAVLNRMGWVRQGPGLRDDARRADILRALAEEASEGWKEPGPHPTPKQKATGQALTPQPADPRRHQQMLDLLRKLAQHRRTNPTSQPPATSPEYARVREQLRPEKKERSRNQVDTAMLQGFLREAVDASHLDIRLPQAKQQRPVEGWQ